MMRRVVFIDTWGWIGWTVRRDVAHQQVVELSHAIRRDDGALLTTNFVLAEALTRLRLDESLEAALRLVDAVGRLAEASLLRVVGIDERLWQAGLGYLRRFDDHRLSFVDCTSFAVMAAEGVHEAMTADRHFAAAGFTALGA